jgi:hypothetical protein
VGLAEDGQAVEKELLRLPMRSEDDKLAPERRFPIERIVRAALTVTLILAIIFVLMKIVVVRL